MTAGPIVGERVEAARELGGDVANALGVGRAHRRGLVAQPQQQLLVECCGVAVGVCVLG